MLGEARRDVNSNEEEVEVEKEEREAKSIRCA